MGQELTPKLEILEDLVVVEQDPRPADLGQDLQEIHHQCPPHREILVVLDTMYIVVGFLVVVEVVQVLLVVVFLLLLHQVEQVVLDLKY